MVFHKLIYSNLQLNKFLNIKKKWNSKKVKNKSLKTLIDQWLKAHLIENYKKVEKS